MLNRAPIALSNCNCEMNGDLTGAIFMENQHAIACAVGLIFINLINSVNFFKNFLKL